MFELMVFLFAHYCRPTVCVAGGWGEQGSETETCQSSDKCPQNAQTPTTMAPVPFRGSGARCVSPLCYAFF